MSQSRVTTPLSEKMYKRENEMFCKSRLFCDEHKYVPTLFTSTVMFFIQTILIYIIMDIYLHIILLFCCILSRRLC
jgi:hypothetical protein